MITKTLREEYFARVSFAIREALPQEQQPEELAQGIVAIGLAHDITIEEAVQWIHLPGHRKRSLATFESHAQQLDEARGQLATLGRRQCERCGREMLRQGPTLYCPDCGEVKPV